MGEAKRRGSFEERSKAAIERDRVEEEAFQKRLKEQNLTNKDRRSSRFLSLLAVAESIGVSSLCPTVSRKLR